MFEPVFGSIFLGRDPPYKIFPAYRGKFCHYGDSKRHDVWDLSLLV
jgi:hypothetical protein